MAFATLFQVFLFVSLMVSGSCIAGTNELDGIKQGGDGYLASYLMLKVVSGLETDIQELKGEVDLKAEVEDTQELKADMQVLKAEVDLKAEVQDTQELKADIQELKAEVANTQELKAEVANTHELKAEVQKLKVEVANIQELKAEVAEMQEMKAEVANTQELKAEVQKLKADVANTQELKVEIADLKSKYKDQPKTIFAQMQLLGDHTYQPGDRVYFTNTKANVGNAYDTQHGYFEAPCDGTYLFSVTLCTRNNNWVVFRIVQDGNNILGEGHPGDPAWHACAPSTVVTQMKRGSRVWVEMDRVKGGTIRSAYGMPSFTGVFLNNYKNP